MFAIANAYLRCAAGPEAQARQAWAATHSQESFSFLTGTVALTSI